MPGITAQRLVSAVLLAVSVLTPSASAAQPTAEPTTAATSPAASPLPSVSLPLPGAVEPSVPAQVLPAVSASGALPTPARLAAVLGPLLTRPALGTSVSAEVIDVATGTSLYAKDAVRPAAPASATKILTSAAALTALGPDATLPTRVVAGAHPDEVVLVGGGDVMLGPGRGNPLTAQGHAGLADLADATAASLRARGTTTVALRLDDTLFTGPAVSPSWSSGDVNGGYVAPVMAVEVTVGVTRPARPPVHDLPSPRLKDPALSTAKQLATLLAARGIIVVQPIVRAQAPQQATVLGEVRSASIADIVELVLTESDNTAAEALARLVAISTGRKGTFEDGGRAVLEQVARLGVPITGARMPGGSGLGRGTAIPVSTIARTLALAAAPEQVQLRAVLSGLPVAGASGTLADRFVGPAQPGIGVVRAKTGTLTGVSALAGTVVDADGRLLTFAVVADTVPVTVPGRAALDVAAAALARCGCR